MRIVILKWWLSSQTSYCIVIILDQ